MDREITKQEFQELYIQYGESQSGSGWTRDYWEHFFEHETGKRYFFTEPTDSNQTRMYIVSGQGTHRIYLLREEDEE